MVMKLYKHILVNIQHAKDVFEYMKNYPNTLKSE